jgi:HSP20 family protein
MLNNRAPDGGLRQGYWDDKFMEVHQQMNRIFNEALNAQYIELATMAGRPAVNISETDTAIILRAELLGMNPEDITIRIQDDILTLMGNKKPKMREGKMQDISKVHWYNRFTRSFLLPVQVKQEERTTTFRNGVLEVVFPKA